MHISIKYVSLYHPWRRNGRLIEILRIGGIIIPDENGPHFHQSMFINNGGNRRMEDFKNI
jgi:hypothetical protein